MDLYPLRVTIQETEKTPHFFFRQVGSQLQKNLAGSMNVELRQMLEHLHTRRTLRVFPQAEDPDVGIQYEPAMRHSHGRRFLRGYAQARPTPLRLSVPSGPHAL